MEPNPITGNNPKKNKARKDRNRLLSIFGLQFTS